MPRASKLAAAGLVIGLAAAIAPGPRPAIAAEPAAAPEVPGSEAPAAVATIDRFHAALLDVMRRGSQLDGAGRYRALAPAIDQALNLPLMTQVAVGARWSNLSAEQQAKLVDAFRRFTIATYASNFDSYDGQRFETTGNPRPIAGGVVVTTRLVTAKDAPVQLDYVMRETTGAWQVVDVFAQGTISELARRRSEFTAILSRDGADGLVDRLAAKAQTLIGQPA
jgi:phospholipid transport system substrate-binding protein